MDIDNPNLYDLEECLQNAKINIDTVLKMTNNQIAHVALSQIDTCIQMVEKLQNEIE